ncbi:hypothetical protein [Paludibaculum fermentans]|uniref:hypothetical protein n=1 Tax=Paludibaculum fermentans TaxID=1473598 RepID=UPI003EB6B46D
MNIAGIARDFCTLCLGWEEGRALNFTDLAAVLEAAGEWCQEVEVVMALQFVPITGSWYVQLSWGNECILYGCSNLAEIPELVMCACLEARRRRTAASASRFKSWRRDFSVGCTRN